LSEVIALRSLTKDAVDNDGEDSFRVEKEGKRPPAAGSRLSDRFIS